nr:hypothetical protein BaRGS_000905 [Batillaria attramentaria]
MTWRRSGAAAPGGLVFLMVWVLFLLFWSIPMLLIEYSTGRYTQHGVIDSFRQLMSEKFAWCGGWIMLVNFMIAYVVCL